MSRYESARCHSHGAVVVRSAIKHMPSSVVRDPHERIVRCALMIIPVGSRLRHSIETIAGNDVRPAATNYGRGRLDTWRPSRIVGSRRVINRDEEEVREEN